MDDFFETFSCRLSRSLVETLRTHTAEAEYEDGYNEFVEAALRRSLREGWDSRHENASRERAVAVMGRAIIDAADKRREPPST